MSGEIHFDCPGCQTPLGVPLSMAGHSFNCPSCARAVEVPSPPGATEQAPAASPAAKLSKPDDQATGYGTLGSLFFAGGLIVAAVTALIGGAMMLSGAPGGARLVGIAGAAFSVAMMGVPLLILDRVERIRLNLPK
jgi:hypothetical protein